MAAHGKSKGREHGARDAGVIEIPDSARVRGFVRAPQHTSVAESHPRIPNSVSLTPSRLLVKDDDFARSTEADFPDHARAIGILVVYNLVGGILPSPIHNFPFGGRHHLTLFHE